ncbi:putative neural cell adhesion molecule l1, partial [Operophtera brumata]
RHNNQDEFVADSLFPRFVEPVPNNARISLSYNDHRSWYLHVKNVQEVDRGWYIATGYPEPYVMWRREDGQEFNCNGESVNVVDGENLTISKVSRLHMGAYLCIASNGVPPSISKRVFLMVQSKLCAVPPMLSIPNQLEAAYIGQDVTLECHTEAYPSSINYWTTDRGDMIISVSPRDFSSYRCVAKNSLGETDGLIRLDGTSTRLFPPILRKHKNRWRDGSAENRVIGDYEVEEWKDVDQLRSIDLATVHLSN